MASLAGVNLTLLLAALITGPLQGHALGPTGRGEVAEVLVPVSLSAVIAEFGLGMFASREAARGRSAGVLLGTVGSIFLVIGAIVALGSNLLATLVVGGHEPVHRLLRVGFILVPLGLLGNLTSGMCAGLQRWRAYNLSRLIPPLGALTLMPILYLFGALTVTTAVAVSFLTGALALLPPLIGLRGGGPLRFDPRLAREGVRFGSKSWLSTLLGSTSMQVLQLMMIAFVGPTQLGLFAVASNVASSSDMLSTAVGGAIFPRVAAGDRAVTARAARVTILLVTICSLVAGLLAPLLVPVAFGRRFSSSVPMVEILLVAVISGAANAVYVNALVSAGRPGLAAVGDGLFLGTLALTLFLLLPTIGGLGAPLAYAGASLVSAAYSAWWCHRLFSVSARDLCLIRRVDLRWSRGQLLAALGHLPWLAPIVPATFRSRVKTILAG